MKRNKMPRKVSTYLAVGLLLTTVTPFIGRLYHLPDFIQGFLIGIGLVLEITAVIRIKRYRKDNKCADMG